ncbi:MAG: hypothetical protein KDA68_12590, partial [Planctomycetaceae bacterium]|nr:hypothetical protein [Planctomycetaceae bacterium]
MKRMERRLSSRSGTPPCPPRSRPACIVVLSALISFSLHSISFADETAVVPSRVLSFVEALHAKGYYDTAIDYLDRVEAEQNFDTELRAALFLERGNLLRDLARTQLLPGDYEPTQKLAREAYRKFITVFPSHDKYPEAATEIAQLRQQEIRAILLKYRRAAGGARESLANTFRETAKTIRQEIAEAETQLRERMEKFPKFIDKEESPDLFEKRRRTETGLVNMQLQAAILLFDEAEIASSDEQKRLTNEALKAFENLVANFRSNLVGMYAQLYVGRCQLRLQKATAAQGIFREMMLIRAEDPQVQSLVDEAHLGLLHSLADK